jgi:hypothetical protein
LASTELGDLDKGTTSKQTRDPNSSPVSQEIA